MNRFHRSFVGLMEMSKDGEWTKADEAQKIIDLKDEQLIFLDEDNSRLKEENERLSNTVSANSSFYEAASLARYNALGKIDNLKLVLWIERVVFGVIVALWYLH
jgi:hypothetical protein